MPRSAERLAIRYSADSEQAKVTLEMPDQQLDGPMIDQVIMLLSTDWFFDYWTILGIDVPTSLRACLQRGLRKIVTDFMSGASEYWLVPFTEDRLDRTRSALGTLLKTCETDQVTIEGIDRLTSRTPGPDPDGGVQWIVNLLSEALVSGSSRQALPQIDPLLKQAVSEAWNRSNLPDINFEELNLNSNVPWDQYIRSLTTNLPTRLSDLLTLELVGKKRFELLWQFIHRELSPTQRDELLEWYRAAAKSVTGGELTLPELA